MRDLYVRVLRGPSQQAKRRGIRGTNPIPPRRIDATDSTAAIAATALLAVPAWLLADLYTVDGAWTRRARGSKKKPRPIALKFYFQVESDNPAVRGTPIETFAIGSCRGFVTYPGALPHLQRSAQANRQRQPCSRVPEGQGRRVGSVQNLVGPWFLAEREDLLQPQDGPLGHSGRRQARRHGDSVGWRSERASARFRLRTTAPSTARPPSTVRSRRGSYRGVSRAVAGGPAASLGAAGAVRTRLGSTPRLRDMISKIAKKVRKKRIRRQAAQANRLLQLYRLQGPQANGPRNLHGIVLGRKLHGDEGQALLATRSVRSTGEATGRSSLGGPVVILA